MPEPTSNSINTVSQSGQFVAIEPSPVPCLKDYLIFSNYGNMPLIRHYFKMNEHILFNLFDILTSADSLLAVNVLWAQPL